jgi:lipopolysaccharide transport system permease protein
MTIVNSSHARRGAHRILAEIFSPRRSTIAIRDGLGVLWKHRALCRELVRRDLSGAYASQALGSFWVIGHPLSLLAIYAFVFAVVLKVKIPTGDSLPRDYTNYILSGLVPWIAISQSLGRATTTLISQANMVKQVVFPIEILPMAGVISSLAPVVISMPVIVAYQLMSHQSVPMTVLLAPLFLVALFLFMSGLAFILSTVTPFFRDIKDAVTVFLTAGVYLIPAFFLPSWVPALFAPVIIFNPFSYPIWVCQDIFFFGYVAHPTAWIVFFCLALTLFAFGYRVFGRLKPYVANVL